MRDAEINEIIFNVLVSRIRRESHCAKSIKLATIKKLVKSTKKILMKEKSLLELNETERNFVVVGDIHGNIDDLIQIFQKFGYPPKQKYIFLGDYVDRGFNSVEVLLLLYSLKVKYPDFIFLLRGNHETKRVSSSYGFKSECCAYFSKKIYSSFIESFRFLPIAATLNNSIFCVHGGLSPDLFLLNDIADIIKPIEGSSKIVSEILWSDPSVDVEAFQKSPRGSGYLFGSHIVDRFLEDNNLKMIIRGHEFCDNGFNSTFKNCLTVFSAIDYQGRLNQSAVAIVNDSKVDTFVFDINSISTSHGKSIIIPDWIFSEQILLNVVSDDDISLTDLLTDDLPVLV